MKRNSLAIIFLASLITHLSAQVDSDWIEQEIRTKAQWLGNRRVALAQLSEYANTSAYDVAYYGLNFHFDIDNSILYGNVIIRGSAVENNLQQIDFDMDNNLSVTSIGGDAVAYTQRNNILSLKLNKTLNKTDTFSVSITYSGAEETNDDRGIYFQYHNSAPVISTLSEPYYAHTWFPCKDRLGDKADSVDINITVPSELKAVSNGTLVRIIENADSTRTYCWQERYPIAVYLISLAISDYTYWSENYSGIDGSSSMPLEFWVYPDYETIARPFLNMTADMMTYFASLWGEYPFIAEKYGQVQFSWNGGMEHQTATSLGSFSEMLICHELAHSWWGNDVTCASWKHIWLNEGFARYAEALWRENVEGTFGLQNYMKDLNRPSRWRSGSLYVQDTSNVNNIFNQIVYDKGAWVLHMLRGLVGNENFSEILKHYRGEYSGGYAATADFQKKCEEIYGRNLDWFFEQWVYGVGQPHYQVNWQAYRHLANSWKIKVAISQIQTSATIFRMPLTLLFSDGLNDTTFTITDSLETQYFSFFCNFKPDSIVLDPENWVLKNVNYFNSYSERQTLPEEFRLHPPYPNPFNQLVNIKIDLPYDIHGRLAIYDLTGREVAVLKDGLFKAGCYNDRWQPQNVASGLYFVSFKARYVNLRQKIVYLK
ncbi:MAG TPA: M1 family aminopeptidase [Candidatus Marinimicrobia bacterium]|nr:M1 family aminopeptidase [Candidatus Neomarinimicrobiota bacterium]HRS51367.1 M1 family aminopeptidase [Candidatus Neomarinimicrobiota bacterium]HRU92261.1 M1 family aminopeptidase [Candidatus Neomarinimicrobiota bacterium]